LPSCYIASLSYAIDTSTSMAGTSDIWKPAALDLLNLMKANNVNIDQYHLYSYMDKVKTTFHTDEPEKFYGSVRDVSNFEGGTELTLAGVKFALEKSEWHNFIVVFTDELGDDTTNQTLVRDIENLKKSTHSEIFFMVVPKGERIESFWSVLAGIGHVIDIKNRNYSGRQVFDIMEDSLICQEKMHGRIFLYTFIINIIAVTILGLVLWLDWRFGGRYCYSHIVRRNEGIHCENRSQRERRLQQEKLRTKA